MDREVWQHVITETSVPAWRCPVCKLGHTHLEEGAFRFEETAESVRWRNDDGWDPDWIDYAFTAWAYCTNPGCGQRFCISGNGGISETYDEDGVDWGEYFLPKHCYPMPWIIEIPKKCPREIKEELKSAFLLFWSHRPACAGRLRVVLELLMDHIGVPTEITGEDQKTRQLKLHHRIEHFMSQNQAVGAQLMALKWLGNTGAHDSSVMKKDLLDAFEILEYALEEIVDMRAERVAELAKKLQDKHSNKPEG